MCYVQVQTLSVLLLVSVLSGSHLQCQWLVGRKCARQVQKEQQILDLFPSSFLGFQPHFPIASEG